MALVFSVLWFAGGAHAQAEVVATLSVSPNPAQTGQSVTLTVTCPSCLPGIYYVIFYDGTTALDGGNAHTVYDETASLVVTLSAGTHLLKAVSGDGSLSTNTVSLTVTAPGTPALPPVPVSPTPVANFEYDAQGNPTKTIVAPATRNYATQHGYDALSRRTTTTDAKSGLTQFGYDLQDQLTSVTDPRQLVTQYQPTGLGDVKQLTSPDTGTATSSFDAAGNLLTRTDARGVLATFTYDELNRLKQTVYSKSGSANRTLSWTYDQTGASYGYGVGRLTMAATPDASTSFRYDALGRVTMTVQSSSVGNPLAVNYAYDAAGHVTSMTYPSGRVVNFGWANGQPTSISLTAGSTTTPLLDQIVMSPLGPVQSWVWKLGSTPKLHERVYDTNGRLVRHPLGLLVRDISYDDADRISRYTHYAAATGQAAAAFDQTFGYDELNRLTNVTGSTNWSYAYDANGNRTASSAGATTRGYTTPATSNQLTALTSPARNMGYDSAGNTLTDNQLGSSVNYTGTYSLEGRLSAMARGTSLGVDFGYDAVGRRVTRGQWMTSPTNPRTYTLYAYDQGNHLIGEYQADGTLITEYVWLGDTPVAVIKLDGTGVQTFAIHTDHLDTPRMIVDANDQVRWRWMGEPFGANVAEEQPTAGLAVLQQNLRFPGQQHEAFGGRFYNHFRDYDPTIGRYVQSDPIGLAGGINTYAYVGGSPVNRVDPLGLWATDAHNYFIDLTFPNLPPEIRDIIKEGSAYSDKMEYQGADYAFMHAMSSKSMTPEESRKKMCEYIKSTMSDANDELKAGNGRYWFLLGMALHPAMDSTSPAHEGFQQWRGIFKDGNRHGGMPGSLEDINTAKQPYHRKRTLERMRDVLNGNTSSCGCN